MMGYDLSDVVCESTPLTYNDVKRGKTFSSALIFRWTLKKSKSKLSTTQRAAPFNMLGLLSTYTGCVNYHLQGVVSLPLLVEGDIEPVLCLAQPSLLIMVIGSLGLIPAQCSPQLNAHVSPNESSLPFIL